MAEAVKENELVFVGPYDFFVILIDLYVGSNGKGNEEEDKEEEEL